MNGTHFVSIIDMNTKNGNTIKNGEMKSVVFVMIAQINIKNR